MCSFFLQFIFSCILFVYRLEVIVNALVLVASLHNRRHVYLCLEIRKSAYCFREWLTVCRKLHGSHPDLIHSGAVVTPRFAVGITASIVLYNRHIPVRITGCSRRKAPVANSVPQTSTFPIRVQGNRMFQRWHVRSVAKPSWARLLPSCVSHLRLGSSLKVSIASEDILLRLRSVEVGLSIRVLIHRNVRNRRLCCLKRLL